MKTNVLIISVILLCLVSCKNTVGPTYDYLGSMRVTADEPYELTGGARWFSRADTGVWYDVFFSYRIDNSGSSIAKKINYKLEIGFFINGKFQYGNGQLAFSGDSVLRGTSPSIINARTDAILDIQETFGVGRRNNDWSWPYGFRLTLYDTTSNNSVTIEDAFINSSLNGDGALNRYKGVIYTTEQSSDSLGVLDGPAYYQWEDIPELGIHVEPVFPNPASTVTTMRITFPSDQDSLMVAIYKTDRVLAVPGSSYNFPGLKAGTYSFSLDVSQIPAGEYRIKISIPHNGFNLLSGGQIWIQR